MRVRRRTWRHPGGWGGPGWGPEQVRAFEALMRSGEVKTPGAPALVVAWDDGRGIMPWYTARAGADEFGLVKKCREIFGCREREPLPLE